MQAPGPDSCENLAGSFEPIYRLWNPDVDVAIAQGTMESAQVHWEVFGKRERRAPFDVPGLRFPGPRLEVGDRIVQRIVPKKDWLGGISLRLATYGALSRIALSGKVSDAKSGEVLAVCDGYREWLADIEEIAIKFPPIECTAGRACEMEVVIHSVECPGMVRLWCMKKTPEEFLTWNSQPAPQARVWMELHYTPLTLPGPLGVIFNPVNHCAAECIHCLARPTRKEPGKIDDAMIEALKVHFDRGPGDTWCIDYATDFFRAARSNPELLDLVADRGDIVINTDGQHVTEPALRRIFEGRVRKLAFSCDAATEETYAVVRKGLGRLSTVVDAARIAVRVRRELAMGDVPWIALSMVVMRTNVHEAARMVELAGAAGVDAVSFNQVWVCSGDMVEESLTFTPELWRENLERARVRGRELDVDIYTDVAIRPEHPQRGITWCPEPWGSFVLLGNGDVLACASPASKIGNIRNCSIDELWNGPAYQALRRRVNSDAPPLLCNHCPIYRKPGNPDGLFVHHLVDDYDVRRDLMEPGYRAEFERRFSFERARMHGAGCETK